MKKNKIIKIFSIVLFGGIVLVGCASRKYEATYNIPIFYINNSAERQFKIQNDLANAVINVESPQEISATAEDFKVIMDMQNCDLTKDSCEVELKYETTSKNKDLKVTVNPQRVLVQFIN
ncbi:hypothetical protein [Anaerorhabdus sp.]|uniref:Lipoprotein n=1 Tax=bioreactor metagenome TaxID=1076179 RepID=A0A645D8E5_9ZZZZ|nr:hypothetical protein [Anaerorhabdus sp.]MEA4874722.1 hypothetical protein [Anaerorhabdus sp.]